MTELSLGESWWLDFAVSAAFNFSRSHLLTAAVPQPAWTSRIIANGIDPAITG
ncbi:hypothetical protein [Mycobacterium lepromatosis]|uniref:hypothetical protein n=1 Tax=Mycobacterium lepromatosis TaxID=480418 RepID=UPI0012E09323|nr:hypothetical protein [Mycobacterium lepromatosis]